MFEIKLLLGFGIKSLPDAASLGQVDCLYRFRGELDTQVGLDIDTEQDKESDLPQP